MTNRSRAKVRDDLATHMDEITAGVLDAVVREIPAYAQLDATQLHEVAAIARWGTTRMLDLWCTDERLGPEDLRRFQGIGAVRGMDGRPLPAVLRAYRIAASHVVGHVVDRYGDELTVADVAAMSTHWLETVDLLSEAIYTGYERSLTRIDTDLARADLLHDLVQGRQSSAGVLADRCRTLGLTLPEQPQLLLLRPRPDIFSPTPPPLTPEQMAGLGVDLATGSRDPADHRHAQDLYAVRDGLGLLLTERQDPADIERFLMKQNWNGCLVQLPLPEVARAYRIARTCLHSAPLHAWTGRHLLLRRDAEVLSLLAANGDTNPTTVTASVLGSLLAPDQSHLLEGLDALLASGGAATAAATSAGVHAQTMRYRARRIAQVTGCDPRHPWDRFILQVARTTGGTTEA